MHFGTLSTFELECVWQGSEVVEGMVRYHVGAGFTAVPRVFTTMVYAFWGVGYG
jgi:hypothetical protein